MDENSFWEQTQDILQSPSNPLFKKPRLTDALLQRPPFRFLHDIVMAVIKETGFMEDVLTEEETDVKAMANDKEAKCAFLSKVINSVAMAEGEAVDVDPLKIVAGLEPERTNALLQALGHAACAAGAPSCVEAMRRVELMRPPSRRGPTEDGNAPSVLDLTEGKEAEASDLNWQKDGLMDRISRPQTAKKPPPSTQGCVSEMPRQPTSARGCASRPSSAREQSDAVVSYDPTDCISESDPWQRSEERVVPTDGILVRDLKNEAETEEKHQGLILKSRCRKKDDTCPTADLEPVGQALSEFSPLSGTLLRCIENLLDAVEPMHKESLFWEKEASVYAQQLQKAQISQQETQTDETLREMEEELEQRRHGIRSLKDTVAKNEQIISLMLRSLTE